MCICLDIQYMWLQRLSNLQIIETLALWQHDCHSLVINLHHECNIKLNVTYGAITYIKFEYRTGYLPLYITKSPFNCKGVFSVWSNKWIYCSLACESSCLIMKDLLSVCGYISDGAHEVTPHDPTSTTSTHQHPYHTYPSNIHYLTYAFAVWEMGGVVVGPLVYMCTASELRTHGPIFNSCCSDIFCTKNYC